MYLTKLSRLTLTHFYGAGYETQGFIYARQAVDLCITSPAPMSQLCLLYAWMGCMLICMQECMYEYTHTCGRWEQPQMDPPGTICLDIAKQAGWTGQQAPGIYLFLLYSCWDHEHAPPNLWEFWGFCCFVLHGFWGLNSGPHALHSKHLTELSLQPVFSFRSVDYTLGTYW